MSDDLLPAFALIPAGPFVMGSDDGPPDERPAHAVHLDAFAIGVQLVTHAEYSRFIHETGYRPPGVDDLPLVVTIGGEEREREFRAAGVAYAWTGGQPPADRLDHPVTMVRWEDAAAYCRWLSKVLGRVARLPSESEWEKAARGGLDGKPYPWGDGLGPERANFLSDPTRRADAGTTAGGALSAERVWPVRYVPATPGSGSTIGTTKASIVCPLGRTPSDPPVDTRGSCEVADG